ncbi:MAG TPA: arginine decarboxylase, pyruvoyl-dependent [Firmicutes bacterium]|jgi:arginine decarboxylase|nr:arginine decarboxylase, pyruvoyl-dependent [Bacillota bacterium]HAA34125.1 arginine decarboxylase, pyruvoyl-dependent [Bacillota bacterium]
MIAKPEHFIIVASKAEANHTLTAFDAALLKAGLGNVNLVRLSSILPPGCKEEKNGINFPPGAFVPTAYGSACSEKKGELIAAAVGIGFSEDSFGVIMEHSGSCNAEAAREKVEEMIKEAFAVRGLALKGIKIKSVEHRVEKAGAVIAAVALW